jgi:hypothetical protein
MLDVLGVGSLHPDVSDPAVPVGGDQGKGSAEVCLDHNGIEVCGRLV